MEVAGGTIALRWTAPGGGPGITTYVIEAGSSAGTANLAQIATNSLATEFAASGVAPGAYYIRVHAANATGIGPASNDVLAVVPGGGAGSGALPGPPLNLTATAFNGTVSLQWSAASGVVSSYVVEAGSIPGARDLANASTGSTATSFSASGVPAGVYYLRVRAANSAGAGAASNEVALVIGGASAVCSTAPLAPGGLAASVNGSAVTLVWGAAAGQPAAYVLEAGSRPGAADLAVSDVGSATSMTATGVGAGTYFVRVRAKNACGESAPSQEIVVTVR